MDTNVGIKYTLSSVKIPVIDGMVKSRYQIWGDDLIAFLEYNDVEESIKKLKR